MRPGNIRSTHGNPLIKKAQPELEASQIELLTKAYTFSTEKGIDTSCLSYKAAELLLEHGADVGTIAAALLAQALWGGRASKAEIRKALGNGVVNILDGLTLSGVAGAESKPCSQDRIHAFLESAAKTPRKAILVIAFRFIELQNALRASCADSRQLAQETIDLYVPIANRLSLSGLRRKLEDLCFKILEPVEYESLKLRVAPLQTEDDSCIRLLMKGVRRLLSKAGI